MYIVCNKFLAPDKKNPEKTDYLFGNSNTCWYCYDYEIWNLTLTYTISFHLELRDITWQSSPWLENLQRTITMRDGCRFLTEKFSKLLKKTFTGYQGNLLKINKFLITILDENYCKKMCSNPIKCILKCLIESFEDFLLGNIPGLPYSIIHCSSPCKKVLAGLNVLIGPDYLTSLTQFEKLFFRFIPSNVKYFYILL